MLLSLVDIVRCPEPHQESTLVLSVEAWQGQRVWAGTLGCPVCHARFVIHDGVVHFGGPVSETPGELVGEVDAFRIAAQLGLSEPGGVVLLTGRYARAHRQLIEAAEITCILVDAEHAQSPLAVNFDGVRRFPLADGTLRGAAVDPGRATDFMLAEAVRCLRPRARLLAPASGALPVGSRPVAEDAFERVVEVDAPVTRITLTRAKSQ